MKGVVEVWWWCGGLVVSVGASRSPIPGSKLGPGPPHRAVRGAANRAVMCEYCANKVIKH